MLTPPSDLTDTTVAEELAAAWGFTSASINYQPVGFGSHHWLATGTKGDLRFATVDDLFGKSTTGPDPAGQAFSRLSEAFDTALWLRQNAALSFVVAPIPTLDGRVVHRLSHRYSLVLQPVRGGPSGGRGW